MGYQAPSAEEVYRYAFRLDGHHSLIDGFGFSIVLVNDNSAVCREFLQRYCLDLCLRTADRIRFVVFSQSRASNLRWVADALNQGGMDPELEIRRRVRGMVGEDLRFDYEEEPWKSLRPNALRPLRDIEDIERQLHWELFDTPTAMPGTGIAMTFAHRLGIGRHVPCILVFTEIGELHVDLLPMAGLSADDVFVRVREWIDTFYEHNRARIDYWRAVENEIERLVYHANTTLTEIRNWRDKRTGAWRGLTHVSQAIRELETLKADDPSEWRKLSNRYSEPPLLKEVLEWMATALQRVERQKTVVDALKRAAQDVEEATYTEHLQDALIQLRETLPSNIRPGVLDDALHNLEERQNSWQEIKSWWLRSGTRKFSLSNYKRDRKAWAGLPVGKGLKHREEHRLVLDTLSNLPLASDPAQSAGLVIAALARALDVDMASESFRVASNSYRTVVQEFLRVTSEHVPQWLLAWSPQIKVGEAVPLGEDLSLPNVSRLLANRPVLRDALASARAQGDVELAARDREAVSRWREQVLVELRSGVASRGDLEMQLEGIREKALAQLQAVRCTIEAEALTLVAQEPQFERPLAPHMAVRFHEALDEYDRVTKSIEFPHRKDTLIRRVPIAVPVVEAAGIWTVAKSRASVRPGSSLAEATDQRASARLRSSLAEVTDQDTKATRARALEEAGSASPASRLEKALRSSLRSERFSAVAPDLVRLVAEHKTLGLLQSLEPQELHDVAVALGSPAHPDSILITLGLYAGAPAGRDDVTRALAAKVRDDDFDVFMAHNSRDKEVVLEIARKLRHVGIHPWVDVEQIAPGRWFQDALQRVISRVKAVAIFLGRHGLGRWQGLELRAFVSQCVERSLPVIPVLLSGVESIPEELIFLRELHAVRFVTGPQDVHALAQLRWGITGEHREPA